MSGTPIVDWTYCASADCIVSGIYNWQTLIGGLVAIGAAWYAGRVVRGQIKAAAGQETVRYNRRLNAVRSLLPLTLSGMSDYARNAAVCLMGAVLGFRLLEGQEQTPQITPPDVPGDLVTQIAAMIEATDDVNVIRMLRKMIGEVQVLNSRMQGLQMELELEPVGPRQALLQNIDIYLLQCAVIYAQCSAMFEFARFEADTVPESLPWEEVFTAFAVMRVREYEYPRLFEFCARAREEGRNPES
jgi:hypothetical protein